MLDPTTLNDLARRLAGAVPPDLKLMKNDIENTFLAILQSSFARMNLVTREEFDVQKAVLQRTREQLREMEQRISELENAQKPD